MFKNPVKAISWALFTVMLGFMLVAYFDLSEPYTWIYRGIIFIIIFFNLKKIINIREIDKWGFYLTIIYMSWLIFEFFRASFYAEGYWMWKSVSIQLVISLFYIIIIISTNIEVVKMYYSLYWLFFFPLLFISLLYDGTPLLLDYVPFLTLMFFFVLVPKYKKLILLGIVLMFYVTNFQRNDLIKIVFGSLIGLSFSYFYNFIPKWSIRLGRIIFLIAPFILLELAASGAFNVFDMDSYISGNYTQEIKTTEGEEEDNLKADTRTFIYQNVFATMNKYDEWIIGRSPAFGDDGVDDSWGIQEDTGLKGRYGNEVGIMDILLWFGLIGVALYFLIYVRASFLAINRSCNRFAKAIGLYVAFLWMWAFVWEKPADQTFFMMDLVLIGLCFSNKFRQLTDEEVGLWVRGIFSLRLIKK